MGYSSQIGWTQSKMKRVRRSAEGVLDGSMKVPEKPSENSRGSAMEHDLAAPFDELQTGRSHRQEQQRDSQRRGR